MKPTRHPITGPEFHAWSIPPHFRGRKRSTADPIDRRPPTKSMLCSFDSVDKGAFAGMVYDSRRNTHRRIASPPHATLRQYLQQRRVVRAN